MAGRRLFFIWLAMLGVASQACGQNGRTSWASRRSLAAALDTPLTTPSPLAPRQGISARNETVAQFTRSVHVSALSKTRGQARLGGATVTFQPSARTAWHSHPLGKTLIVITSVGWTQVEGGRVVEIRPGDVVIMPADVRHWHGASLLSAMAHIALAESAEGKGVQWFDAVSDEDYRKGLSASEAE